MMAQDPASAGWRDLGLNYIFLDRMIRVLILLFVLLYASGALASVCTEVTFGDGFEALDTPVATTVTGSWLFSLDFEGSKRNFAAELIERSDGRIVGYLMGGTRYRTFVTGAHDISSISFSLELVNPVQTRTLNFSGSLAGNTMTATASGDISTQNVRLQRVSCGLTEQELLLAKDDGTSLVRLSVVTDEDGALVAGGFVSEEDCSLLACDGGVTSYGGDGDTILIGLETDGGCSAGSSLTANWTSDGIYTGTYNFTDCDGTRTGSLLIAFAMGTSSSAVREALDGRVEVAEALEAGIALTEPLDGVSAAFLNFGKNEMVLRADLNREMLKFSSIKVGLQRTQAIRTSRHPRTLPDLLRPLGIKIGETRSGIPEGASTRSTYRDTRTRPVIDDFEPLGLADGKWKLAGNQAHGLDLPFEYSIPTGGSRLEAPTADGHPSYISLGPYGAHFLPSTGDPSGEAKANLSGFLVKDDAEMEELVGNGNGVRDPGETWGYPIGGDLSGERVRLRRPVFTAPSAGVIGKVIYNKGPTGVYFDDEPHWIVLVGLEGDVRMSFGHVGRIAAELRNLVLALTGVDTDTFNGPPGTDLLDGYDPIPIAAGTELAYPQIFADPVPGFPGYYRGGGSFLNYPWAQIEFQIPYSLDQDSNLAGDFCIYRFLTTTRQDELQSVMDKDMLDSASLRYRARDFTERWRWTAQGGLCQAESPLPRDFSSLYTRLGGWFERAEAGTTADELFSFVPIDKTAAAYDPANYHSASVSHLVIRDLTPPPFAWTMPDATIANAFLPAGEVIELSGDTMLIKWRDLNPTNAEAFQRVAYRLDENGLVIKWGNFASSALAASQPILAVSEPCDDTTVLCYDHSRGSWPP